mmetsp:Transcript_25016/g.31275  ORF Transcript_25016/g.31275 Transcript_25016/m.31275 type:complete len:218 (+) Transcript_25016:106-759(+)
MGFMLGWAIRTCISLEASSLADEGVEVAQIGPLWTACWLIQREHARRRNGSAWVRCLAVLGTRSYFVGQLLPFLVVNAQVKFFLHHKLLHSYIGCLIDSLLESFEEEATRLCQVDDLHVFLRDDPASDPDADVVGISVREVFILEPVAAGVGPEFEDASDFLIEGLQLLKHVFDLVLAETDHGLVVVLITRLHLHFNKVLISAEKWELFEEALPGNA